MHEFSTTLGRSDATPNTRICTYGHRTVRFARLLFLTVFLYTSACYVTSRLLSPWRAIQSFETARAAAVQPHTTRRPLRVAAYNIAHGRGNGTDNWDGGTTAEREQRLRDIARFLRESDLDVVVLNEIDFDSSWSGRVNQAEFIAREAGFRYRVEQRNLDVALPFCSWRFGNAVLSRHPISAARLIDYPAYSRWEAALAGKKRGLDCTVDLPEGEQVRVLAVHLSHRSERVRLASARIIDQERIRPGPPLIAIGDFNSTPPDYPQAEPDESGETALSWLLASAQLSTLAPANPSIDHMTFSSTVPNQVIDWILVAKPLRLLSKKVLPLRLSDHRPIVGEIEWNSSP